MPKLRVRFSKSATGLPFLPPAALPPLAAAALAPPFLVSAPATTGFMSNPLGASALPLPACFLGAYIQSKEREERVCESPAPPAAPREINNSIYAYTRGIIEQSHTTTTATITAPSRSISQHTSYHSRSSISRASGRGWRADASILAAQAYGDATHHYDRARWKEEDRDRRGRFLRPPPCPASGLAAKDFVVFRSRVLRVFLFPPLSWLPLSRANIRWIALRVRPW